MSKIKNAYFMLRRVTEDRRRIIKKTTLFLVVFLFFSFSNSYSAQTYRFVVMSDSHNTLSAIKPKHVASAIKKLAPLFVLHCGDFTCCGGGNSHNPLNRFRFDEYAFLGSIPVFPTTGNHDYDGEAQADYNAFWNSHRPNVAINGMWAHTYSFDYKQFHFIAIDWMAQDWMAQDFSWVKKDLTKNSGKPVIIFSHHSALNIGCKPAYLKELNIITQTNPDVKAVFSGHSHCYGKEVIKDGTLQIFTGTVSHDNKRDQRYKGKHTFVVVDVEGENLRICPASVEDGILEGKCGTSP